MFTALIDRRYRKQEKEQNRGLFLQELLGEEKFNHVLAAVQEIRTLRLNTASVGCINSSACIRANNSGSMRLYHPSLPRKIPDPVKNLFFRNRLVQAMDHAPMDKLSTLDWDDLLLEAQGHIQEYQTWSRQQQDDEEEQANESSSEPCE